MRARFGPTRRRASATKLRTSRAARPGADEVERGARRRTRTRSASGGSSQPGSPRSLPRARPRVPAARRPERRRDEVVRALEELVDDLDLADAGPEASRARRRAAGAGTRARRPRRASRSSSTVRLVVEDESPAVAAWKTSTRPRRSTPSCSNANGRSTEAPASAAIRAARSDRQYSSTRPRDPRELLVGRRRIPARAPRPVDGRLGRSQVDPARGGRERHRRSRSRPGRSPGSPRRP